MQFTFQGRYYGRWSYSQVELVTSGRVLLLSKGETDASTKENNKMMRLNK